MNLQDFLSKLEKVKKINFSEYTTCCPAHSDKNPSLSVTEKDGRILLHCHGGCTPEEIVSAMGLGMKDLFENKERYRSDLPIRRHIYRREDGSIVARKNIFLKKDGGKFASWELYKNGSYTKGLEGEKLPLYNLPALAQSDGAVYIAEGEKDADTLTSMGYTATTSPKGAGGRWEPEYNKYLRGREVVILSDNDEAGRKHAKSVIKALQSVAESIRHIPAPTLYPDLKEKGDISDVAAILGLDKTNQLLIEALNAAQVIEYKPIPPFFYYGKTGVLRVDRPILAEYVRQNNSYLFELGEEDKIVRRLWYRDGVYQPISLEEIKCIIKKYITDYDKGALNMSDVEEVVRNITTDDCFVHSYELDSDENIINFRNGILCLDTLELKPHSPDIYSTVQIDCDWVGKPVPTPIFDRFMLELCDEDSGKLKFLTEYIGVSVSNVRGYRMKSALFMVGEGNTGKSQLKSLVERILGERNCAAIDLGTLEARFGTSAIYGKRLSGSSDMSYMSVSELKIFKQITGGDRIFAERKGSSPFYYTYNGVLWFCMNQLPKFGGDRGEWVYDRINIIECNNVIPPEKQDKLICDKMYNERIGIIYQAVMAVRDVIKNGYVYSLPVESRAQRRAYSRSNDPVANFFIQCCEPRNDETPKDSMTTTAIHKAFVRWCNDNEKGYKCSLADFKIQLAKLLKVNESSIVKRTAKGRFFPFKLNVEAYDCYYAPYIKK